MKYKVIKKICNNCFSVKSSKRKTDLDRIIISSIKVNPKVSIKYVDEVSHVLTGEPTLLYSDKGNHEEPVIFTGSLAFLNHIGNS